MIPGTRNIHFKITCFFKLDDSMANGCLTKHPLNNGCLEFQV